MRAVINRELVDRLIHFRTTDAPVLSVHFSVPIDRGELRGIRGRLETLLKPVREYADSSQLDHYQRESLRKDVQRVIELSGRVGSLEGRGVSVFACDRAGVYEEVVLPRRYVTAPSSMPRRTYGRCSPSSTSRIGTWP
jgi:hypothetical protein